MALERHDHVSSESRLAHFPVPFFATVMGLCGLTLAWQKAVHVMGWPPEIVTVLALLAVAVFALTALIYIAKAVFHPGQVREEYNHPVKLHFIPTISISLILLATVALEQMPGVAEPLFLAGIMLHLALTMTVLHNWFNRDHYQPAHLNPAWFIPIVGNVLVPLAGVKLGYVELSWFFYAIGIVFWLVLFAIIVNRVLFHNPLPERLAPTLFILVAPPAVGFLSYVRLTGDFDAMARVLFYFALFMTIFLATQMPRLLRARFFLFWWAYSFPLAAMTVASWVMAEHIATPAFWAIAVTLLVLVTLAVAGLFLRTMLAIVRHEICQPE